MRSTPLTVSALLVSSVAAAAIPYHPLTAESITGNASTLRYRGNSNLTPNTMERVIYPPRSAVDEFDRWSQSVSSVNRDPFSDPQPRPLQAPPPTLSLFQRLKNRLFENTMIKWMFKHPKTSILGGLAASVSIATPIGVKVHRDKCNKLKQECREKNFREIAEAKQGLRQTPGHHKRDLSESEEDLNIKGGGASAGGGSVQSGGGSKAESGSKGTNGTRNSGHLHPSIMWPYAGGGTARPMSQEDLEKKKKKAAETAEQQYALNWDWSVPNCGNAWPF